MVIMLQKYVLKHVFLRFRRLFLGIWPINHGAWNVISVEFCNFAIMAETAMIAIIAIVAMLATLAL